MDMKLLAGEIVCNLGREFPAPRHEMILRQLVSMAEEIFELQEAMEGDCYHALREELADALITVYMTAHYAEIDLTEAISSAALTKPTELSVCASRAFKAGRRWLGIARRSGSIQDFTLALADLALAVERIAVDYHVDLDGAIQDKVDVIFSRGWKESPSMS